MAEENIKVCWLTGSFFQRKDTIRQIKEEASKLGPIEVFVYDDEVSAETVETRVLSFDLFDTGDKTRIFVLKSLPHFTQNREANNKKWTAFFNNIPDHRIVILDDVSATSYPSLYKVVKKIGKTFDYPLYLKRNDAIAMVSDVMEHKGKIMEVPEAELIVESVGEEPRNGYNIDRLYTTLDKLIVYMDSRKRIVERDDIYASVSRRPEFIIWDLLRAMDQRNLPLCLNLFSKSVEQKESADRALEDLLYAAQKKYQLLLFLKEEKLQKKTDNEIISKLKQINSLKGEGKGEQRNFQVELTKENSPKPLYVDTVVRNALQGFYGRKPEVDLYTRGELFRILKCLDECFLKVRSGCDDVESRMLAENIFMTICGTLEDEILTNLRKLPYDTII